jgi:hypothetical protein
MSYKDSMWLSALSGIGSVCIFRLADSFDAAIAYGAATVIIQICTLLILRKTEKLIDAVRER